MTDLQVAAHEIAADMAGPSPAAESTLILDPDHGTVFARIKLLSGDDIAQRVATIRHAALAWHAMEPSERLEKLRSRLPDLARLDQPALHRTLAQATGRPVPMISGELSCLRAIARKIISAAESLSLELDLRFIGKGMPTIACLPVKSDTLAMDIITATFSALAAGHGIIICPDPIDTPAVRLITDCLNTLPVTFLACGEAQRRELAHHGGSDFMILQLPDRDMELWRDSESLAALPGVIFPVRQEALVAADSVPLASLVPSIAASVFHNGGSFRTGPRVIFVIDAIYDQFVEQFRLQVRDIALGLEEEDAFCGPLRTDAQRTALHSQIRLAIEEGAKLVAGGGPPEDIESGFYYLPTVLSHVEPGMTIFKEPVNGPVALLVRVRDVHDATMMMEQMNRSTIQHDDEEIELALEIAGGAEISFQEDIHWKPFHLQAFHDPSSSDAVQHAEACKLLIALRAHIHESNETEEENHESEAFDLRDYGNILNF